MDGTYDVLVVGGGAAGTYAAWRLKTAAVSSSSPLPQDPADRHIALVELSDRIGGRLESLVPPGMEHLRAEFGGMGFTDLDTLVGGLASHFSLQTGPFLLGDGNNLYYLRATRFTVAQATDPSIVPYHLAPDEQKIDPRLLVPTAVEKVFPNSGSWSYEKWQQATAAGYNGRSFDDLGFWNFLSDNMSNEALEFARDAYGHFFEVANWNCREALPWFMGDGASKYSTIVDGYDAIPKAVQAAFAAGGGDTFMSTQVASVQPAPGGAGFVVTDALGETATATAVVLALPRRALELIDVPVLEQPIPRGWVTSVTGQRVMKLFCCYDAPWWTQQLNITSGPSGTDLPVGQVWYFGPDSDENESSLLLASYNDTLDTTFWEGVSSGPRFEGRAGVDVDPNWLAQAPSALMVEQAQTQLAELHGIAIPDPYSAAWKDWSEDPYGGAFYTWNVGVDATTVADAMLQPDPSIQLFVCGEAYSHDQGWVEGALDTAEQVVERLGVEPPSWISP